MNIKYFIVTILGATLSISGVYAATQQKTSTIKPEVTRTPLQICRNNALTKRSNALRALLKEYSGATSLVEKEEATKLEAIKWQVPSSYAVNSQKIAADKKSKLSYVNEKVGSTRTKLNTTYKADVLLCEKLYETSTTTKKTVSTKNKNTK
jgi:hypothetical protein